MLMPDVIWRPELVVAPTEEPIHLADVRDHHLKLSNGNEEDVALAQFVTVARQRLEGYLHRAIPLQTWDLVMDAWPADGVLWIPKPPLLSVESVSYTDGAGTVTVLDAANYVVDAPKGPAAQYGRISPASGVTWPTLLAQMAAVRVRFRCGYLDESVSPAVSTVPELMKAAMRLIVGELYKQRSLSVQDVSQEASMLGAEDLVSDYRLLR